MLGLDWVKEQMSLPNGEGSKPYLGTLSPPDLLMRDKLAALTVYVVE